MSTFIRVHGQHAAQRRRPTTATMTVIGRRRAKTIGFMDGFYRGEGDDRPVSGHYTACPGGRSCEFMNGSQVVSQAGEDLARVAARGKLDLSLITR